MVTGRFLVYLSRLAIFPQRGFQARHAAVLLEAHIDESPNLARFETERPFFRPRVLLQEQVDAEYLSVQTCWTPCRAVWDGLETGNGEPLPAVVGDVDADHPVLGVAFVCFLNPENLLTGQYTFENQSL